MHSSTQPNIDFFNPSVYQNLVHRLENLQPEAPRQWGQMEVAQMLHHLNLAIGSGLGLYQLPDVSNFMTRNINKLLILGLLKRFPPKTQTASPLKIKGDFDFFAEKKLLQQILKKAFETQSDRDWNRHTYFGPMTRADWGKLITIHCNHHFSQFNQP